MEISSFTARVDRRAWRRKMLSFRKLRIASLLVAVDAA